MPTYQDNQPEFKTTDQSEFKTSHYPYSANQSDLPVRNNGGFLKGFLAGSLSASFLWLALGGTLWALRDRTTQPVVTTPVPQTAPAAPTDPGLSGTTTDPTTSGTSGTTDTASGSASTDSAPSTTQPGANSSSSQPSTTTDTTQLGAGQTPTVTGLNLQDSNRFGATLRVEGVSFGPNSIYLDVAATNGGSNEIALNSVKRPAGNSAMYLEDNLGNEYPVVPPADNSEVKIAPSSTASGKFQFLGRIHSNATLLTLKTNPGSFQGSAGAPPFAIASIPVRK